MIALMLPTMFKRAQETQYTEQPQPFSAVLLQVLLARNENTRRPTSFFPCFHDYLQWLSHLRLRPLRR